MMRTGVSLVLCLTVAPAAAVEPVAVKISWEYKDLPLKMEIYEPAASRNLELWEMGSGAKLADLPVAKRIQNDALAMVAGSAKMFVLAMHNPGKQPVHFFAAPHTVEPVEYSLGFKFHCLCINHVFAVPAGGYWYRVVRLELFPGFVGREVDVRHSLVRVDPGRILPGQKKGGHAHDHDT